MAGLFQAIHAGIAANQVFNILVTRKGEAELYVTLIPPQDGASEAASRPRTVEGTPDAIDATLAAPLAAFVEARRDVVAAMEAATADLRREAEEERSRKAAGRAATARPTAAAPARPAPDPRRPAAPLPPLPAPATAADAPPSGPLFTLDPSQAAGLAAPDEPAEGDADDPESTESGEE